MRKVYESKLEGCNRRGTWKDRVDEYRGVRGIHGRGIQYLRKQARSVGIGRG